MFADAVEHEVGLVAVFEHEAEAELAGEADGGEDVVAARGVGADGELAAERAEQHLVAGVGRDVVAAGEAALLVAERVFEGLAEERGDAHAGERGAAALEAVAVLDVVAERDLETGGLGERHLLDVDPGGAEHDAGAADDVARAGQHADGGDPGGAGAGEGDVTRPDRVDGPHLGGHRAGHLVEILGLVGEALGEEAEVDVGVDEAGAEVVAGEIDDAVVGGAAARGADVGDAVALDDDLAALDAGRVVGGVHGRAAEADARRRAHRRTS